MKNCIKINSLILFMFFSIQYYLTLGQNISQPEQIVQQQVEAYNAHDLEAFLSVFSDSSEGYIFPDTLLGKGKEDLRKVMKEFFTNASEVNAKIKKSISFGEYIINHEVATGMPGGEIVEAIVIYKVEKNLIKKVWYIYK